MDVGRKKIAWDFIFKSVRSLRITNKKFEVLSKYAISDIPLYEHTIAESDVTTNG